MNVLARTLSVHNYRSFKEFDVELDPDITILIGRNAVGKTNLIESVQLLTAGQSFRRPTASQLVRNGEGTCRIDLSFTGEGRRVEHALVCSEGKKSFFSNGKRTSAAGMRGLVPSILFCPDHLDMIKRAASHRRAALDDFGIQLNDRYAHLVSSYARIVEQRNSLLKEYPVPTDLLGAWDEALVQTGAALLSHRLSLLERIRLRMVDAYCAIAPTEALGLSYQSTVGEIDISTSRAEIEELFRGALARAAEDERRRGITVVGPHRDEISFSIDGREARDFASQGQQRSLVLAWKIAEAEVASDILGRYPMLLLDDVMSELDARRREAITGFVQGEIQTIITTTNLGYFSNDVIDRAKVVHIDGETK